MWFTGFKDALSREQGGRDIVVTSKVKGKKISIILFFGILLSPLKLKKRGNCCRPDLPLCLPAWKSWLLSSYGPKQGVFRFNNSGDMSPCTKPEHKFGSFLNQYFFYFLQSGSSFHHQTVRNGRRSQRVIVFLSFHWNILHAEVIRGSYITEKSQVSSLPRHGS